MREGALCDCAGHMAMKPVLYSLGGYFRNLAFTCFGILFDFKFVLLNLLFYLRARSRFPEHLSKKQTKTSVLLMQIVLSSQILMCHREGELDFDKPNKDFLYIFSLRQRSA